MITLKTLHKATEQEVFDQAAKHLLKQNKKALNSLGRCVYRGENGLKCAAGCFIADDEYNIDMENTIYSCLQGIPNSHISLIADLQKIHDFNEVSDWKKGLRSLAIERGLNYSHI